MTSCWVKLVVATVGFNTREKKPPVSEVTLKSKPPGGSSTSDPASMAGVSSTVWPSLMASRLVVITGGSLIALTVMRAVSVAVLNALLPPLMPVSAKSPMLPLLRSQARKSRLGRLPVAVLKFALGAKAIRV